MQITQNNNNAYTVCVRMCESANVRTTNLQDFGSGPEGPELEG